MVRLQGPRWRSCLSKRELTIDLLCEEDSAFSERESEHRELSLFGVTDGKAIGTYLEHKFQANLPPQLHLPKGKLG